MNKRLSRRNFLLSLASNLTLFTLCNLFLKKRINAKSKPKVLIVGSGIGGLSCLNNLNKISDVIDIIVIDKNKNIRTGPLSNLVLGDIISEDKITFEVNPKKYNNVKFIYDEIKYIDPDKKIVKVSDDVVVNFDFAILSPGVGYKDNIIDGYDPYNKELLPHCWDGDSDLKRFKKELNDIEKKSTIIISSPDYPYRCPPAPYERASLIANYLKKKKIDSKILIFDSKDSFTKQENFLNEWDLYYKNIIEWIPRQQGGKIIYFDNHNNIIKNEQGNKIKADLIHFIPDQKAADIFSQSNLLDKKKDWCKINPVTFELDGFDNIFVLGDSINAWDMPKSAFSANSQARVLAINLVNKILDREFIDPVFLNTCYSFSKENRAFSITAWYRLNADKDRIVSLGSSQSSVNSSNLVRNQEAGHAFGWFETMVNDLFL